MKTNQEKSAVNITFQLAGKEAELFMEYKAAQFLKNSAEAARKLMLERLHEVIQQRPRSRRAKVEVNI